MKLKAENTKPEDVKIHAQQHVKKQLTLVGSGKLIPGHRVFEIDPKANTVIEAEYERIVVFDQSDRRKIMVKPNCFYVPALNKKNAIKRFKRGY